MLKKFAEFLLRGRTQASFLALLFALLPLLNWVSAVIVALVTLRKGAKEGFWVLLWAILPSLAVAYSTNSWLFFLNSIVGGMLLIWLLSIVLRNYSNWTVTLEFGALIGLLTILIAHLVVGNLPAWWSTNIVSSIQNISQQLQLNIDAQQVKIVADYIGQFATGLQVAMFLFSSLIQLGLARGLQAKLFNPGGLRQELCSVRMNVYAVILLVVIAILAWFGSSIFKDFMPVLILPFILASFSLIHGYLILKRVSLSILIGVYVLLILILIFLSFAWGVLIVLAVADAFCDFRKRITIK